MSLGSYCVVVAIAAFAELLLVTICYAERRNMPLYVGLISVNVQNLASYFFKFR